MFSKYIANSLIKKIPLRRALNYEQNEPNIDMLLKYVRFYKKYWNKKVHWNKKTYNYTKKVKVHWTKKTVFIFHRIVQFTIFLFMNVYVFILKRYSSLIELYVFDSKRVLCKFFLKENIIHTYILPKLFNLYNFLYNKLYSLNI